MASESPIPKVYNADEVLCELFGHVCEGFAEGSLLEIDDNEDAIKAYVGTTGEVALSRVSNPLAILTLRLAQTSASNDVLSAQLRATRAGIGLSGTGPATVKDMNGRTEVDGRAIVMKAPKITMGPMASEREWKILIIKTNRFDGGNNQVGV